MHPTTSLCLIKPSLWTTTSGRKRIARGSSVVTRSTLTSLTKNIILPREVEATVPTVMEATSIGETTTTIMATGPMVTTGTITPVETTMVITMAIAMDITMGTIDNSVPTLKA